MKKNTELSKGDTVRMDPDGYALINNDESTSPIPMWIPGIGEVIRCEEGQTWVEWDNGLETVHQSTRTYLMRVEDEQ